MNKLIISILSLLLLLSCSQEEEFGPSIFDVEDQLVEGSASYVFDTWLRQVYLVPYNLDFRYRMEDVGSDMDYNLVPTSFNKARQMAQLVKYLWFDVYGTVVSPEFLKENGPRIIHLIGSPAYNPISGTMLLGTRCNELDPTDVDLLNEYYFKTMHHEFAHILHQKRNYPVEFGLISQGKYNPLGWQYKTDSEAATLGFVSPYAGSQNREDFVEIIANYLVKSDAQWNAILQLASQPGVDYYGVVLPDDGIDGRALILQKLEMAKKWLKDSWEIEIDSLRAEIIRRQLNINEVLN
jgi:substrate import-associated zinc metallohydrolase lipoprotein